MKQVDTVMTWYWTSPNARFKYTTEHVNMWANHVRKNTTLPINILCVTDEPDGLESWIHVQPIPKDFEHFSTPTWQEQKGLPQCFKRIAMFKPDAAKTFGSRFASMDIDVLIKGNLDELLSIDDEFAMLRGTNIAKRPYNGSLVIMDAGCRPDVYNNFTPEGAVESGRIFVGSDQAWIAYCLSDYDTINNKWVGRERLIYEEVGVTYYSKAFILKNGGYRNFKAPKNISVIFFPGDFKVFHDGEVFGGGFKERQVAKRLILPANKTTPMKQAASCLFAYDDPKSWGKYFKESAEKKGERCRLFKDPQQVTPGSMCFVRLDQQGNQRDISKNIVARLHNKGCITLPTRREAVWYDDKGIQTELLRPLLPETHIIKDRKQAIEFANNAKFPIISKSFDGAGTNAVRKLMTKEDAINEVKQVFSPRGMKSVYNRKQKDYVLWQKYIPCNETFRTTIIGDYITGYVRPHNTTNGDWLPVVGQNYPMTFDNDEQRKLAELTFKIADKIGTKWMAFDFIKSNRGKFFLLEISAAWSIKPGFLRPHLYTHSLEQTGMTGENMFDVAVEVLLGISY